MNSGVLSSIVVLDVFVLGLIVLASVNGYRKGWVRAFFSLFWVFVSLIATALFYKSIALFLQVTFETSSPFAMVLSFVFLFVMFYAIARVINFFIAGLLKSIVAGSVISNVVGIFFGAFEAILVIGIIFMNISFYPVKPPLKDSFSFKIIREVPIKAIEYSLWFTSDSPENNSNENENR